MLTRALVNSKCINLVYFGLRRLSCQHGQLLGTLHHLNNVTSHHILLQYPISSHHYTSISISSSSKSSENNAKPYLSKVQNKKCNFGVLQCWRKSTGTAQKARSPGSRGDITVGATRVHSWRVREFPRGSIIAYTLA